jgi:hypothetical protein
MSTCTLVAIHEHLLRWSVKPRAACWHAPPLFPQSTRTHMPTPMPAHPPSLLPSLSSLSSLPQTRHNLADMLVQHAELCCPSSGTEATSAPGRAAARALYDSAMEEYSRACGLSSSENGDDLPGLLHNWGVALLSVGKRLGSHAERRAALEQAAQRLKECAQFDRADPAPLVALGDALVAQGEVATGPKEAAQAVEAAIVQGYRAALAVNASHPDALVGLADACLELAKLQQAAALQELQQKQQQQQQQQEQQERGPDRSGAAVLAGAIPAAGAEALRQAASAYEAALRRPEALGGFEDRSEVRFNYCCCLARCGRGQEAQALLAQLLRTGAVRREEVAADEDLSALGAAV